MPTSVYGRLVGSSVVTTSTVSPTAYPVVLARFALIMISSSASGARPPGRMLTSSLAIQLAPNRGAPVVGTTFPDLSTTLAPSTKTPPTARSTPGTWATTGT